MTASLSLTASRPDEVRAPLERLISRAQLVDGQPPFNDQAIVDARSGARTLVLARSGETVAGAIIIGHGEFEFVVDPEWRGNGLGGLLLERILDGPDGPERSVAPDEAGSGLGSGAGPRTLSAWAHGDHPASRILATRTGFAPVRTLYQLRMSLGAAGDEAERAARTVPGVTIDAFRPGVDDEAWVELNAHVFEAHPEQGSVTVGDLRARMTDEWFDADDFLVARRGEAMVGYNWLKIPGEDEPGEIYVVGVDSSLTGRGLGRALMLHGLDRLRERGARVAALYVDASNEGAVRLYRSLGFTDHTVDVQYRRDASASSMSHSP